MEKHISVLSAYGLAPENVVKAGVSITGREYFVPFYKVYVQDFVSHRPSRATVISGLAIYGAVFEIVLIASFEPVLA